MIAKTIFPFLSASLLAMASCSDDASFVPNPQPEPDPYVEYACPKAGDIYKIFPDTLFINKSGVHIMVENKLEPLHAETSSFTLATCEGKFHDRNETINSPLSWAIKRGEQTEHDIVYATQGVVKIDQLIQTEDVKKILEFADGEKMEYSVALLNFNQDTIQANTITVIYKDDSSYSP